ncbi:MAG: tetratricopeptide repeat protein [Sphingomonadaceae bacterium]|uniref:tetratricopeptide repeat protein n=1 Tax=Thermaurantiacus sp. TaxID=2820283 RepID=UPI00298EF61B|nr:tetratricopeptide repeat protein [Thermaurantiacus sp.]MCS6986457.1 tetratricopeptide repeat protein [Sphingomonadaceae bacterium]MDW8414282.1 tetratricopeptide repeat protein [Thermaurantiacus sp.]
MAQPPAVTTRPDDDPFLREVDEAYRADALRRFLGRYGRWLLLAVGLALAGFGGFLLWEDQRRKAAEAQSEKLVAAARAILERRSSDADTPLAEVADQGTPGQRALARMAQAGLAADRGDRARAVALLAEVAADPSAPEPLRAAAEVRRLRLEFDRLKPDAVLARARPFLEGDSPWFPAVAELAGLAHLEAGRRAEAAALFLRLAASPAAPAGQRTRAAQMAAALGADTSRLAPPGAAGSGREGEGPGAS